MSTNRDLNNKLFDIILEEAIDMYAQDISESTFPCDMTDEELKIMFKQKQNIYKNVKSQINKVSKKQHHLLKRCIILAACISLTFVLAINVSAFRVFVYKTYIDMSGTILNMKTNKVSSDNYNNILFSQKDEIIIPDWLPPETELSELSGNEHILNLQYENNDIWINITEKAIPSIETGLNIETDNNIFEISDCKILDMEGKIVELISETNYSIFTVKWCSDSTEYEITTNCSKIMLETILANLKYLYSF